MKRRDLLKSGVLGTLTAGAPLSAAPPRRRAGIEGQRQPDLGNGRFLNPLLSGDRPDPAILKDGDDYYMPFFNNITSKYKSVVDQFSSVSGPRTNMTIFARTGCQ